MLIRCGLIKMEHQFEKGREEGRDLREYNRGGELV
jgi:hypothetical protein